MSGGVCVGGGWDEWWCVCVGGEDAYYIGFIQCICMYICM